ncbi:Asp-tRNA(Asn)/Glu-tRNA(Gln) amidotransferase GatCAB subunit C [bacterium CG_4_10_14_0_2_um_filter_33_32]|nr:MAG: asparaginyl/glutamyl-tRNA amidotransferase subunit C [bacterium CG2_30_33_46]PIW81052.1 MAG: Asp-tRNA(Asn)/Glu-tRNA(Gln) amidotransferase GatCAB subunit C [bacterium CG_4_8_14_3_um_filter_33_28]PIY85792.1 MAG: Asp-tRNA(Asn)/Glu-tRNA(Gln) amidotransferase GatCAB subunit C [bacterium CG_4_10_14_0_8_um_filter_33_57]PIZ85270.1 MAG: Asp-tRNA(Asn)/Glu-tRNA(Gln) amidotransferase GatCAB subunit C [bacterium CG_4_10_14_0_2_um_filter_33_32]PJA72507.1 MAG: Asp-tRNA(Asn)/Glu-tRNA(Gln) amidotransfer
MSKISKEEVKNIAILSRIELSDDEIVKFEGELSSILDFVSKLQGVDTSSIKPLSHVTGLENSLREDEIKDCLNRDKLLENLPERQDKFIKVKKVFEKEDIV